MTEQKKIAIIGASSGQLPLVKKAKELGLTTYVFAWDKDAVCKNYCDLFIPISIFETDAIVDKCKELGVDGVTSNASEDTALAVSKVVSKLGMTGNPVNVIETIQSKDKVREITKNIEDLSTPKIYKDLNLIEYPCIVKPKKGYAKRGVSFCKDSSELNKALEYAEQFDDFIIEEFIDGKEYSVECISFLGDHQVIQITEKITTGGPHFVELEHHQPAEIENEIKEKINKVVPRILSKLNFKNGASHVEIKIKDNNIYLIEVNPRGGGDRISDTLVSLSTDFDYLKAILNVALGDYKKNKITPEKHSGIIFLNKQNEKYLSWLNRKKEIGVVESFFDNLPLKVSISNYDRNGYIIYQSEEKKSL